MSPGDTEIWRSYPDDVEAMMKIDSQTWEPRMALTPFFAHEVCCWMIMLLCRCSLEATAWMHAPVPAFHCDKLDVSCQLLVNINGSMSTSAKGTVATSYVIRLSITGV